MQSARHVKHSDSAGSATGFADSPPSGDYESSQGGDTSPQSRAPDPEVNILLAGSTGHGKSALGNILLNADEEHIWDNRTFQVGDCRESCTDSCSVRHCPNSLVTVMDTPGLNESHERDLPNMIKVVKAAHELGSVHAVVLVMKVDSRMDQTYKDTVLYYEKLLTKEIFKNNLIIVLSGYQAAQRKYRQKPELIGQICKQSADDVKNLLGLQNSPFVHCIDSLPDKIEDLDSM